MNLPCTWHRVNDYYHELRTPRGIVLASCACDCGRWFGEVKAKVHASMTYESIGPGITDLDTAKAAAEVMVTRSV
jgi:hypothetical protein